MTGGCGGRQSRGADERCLFWRRELARPYGRVDRARLKRMLLERCIAQGAPLAALLVLHASLTPAPQQAA